MKEPPDIFYVLLTPQLVGVAFARKVFHTSEYMGLHTQGTMFSEENSISSPSPELPDFFLVSSPTSSLLDFVPAAISNTK